MLEVLESEGDYPTVMEVGVVVEVPVMMELEVWDTLKYVVEEAVVSVVEANILSSVGAGDVDAVPRPGLGPAGSVMLLELNVSTVCTEALLQPNPGDCSPRYSTFTRYNSALHLKKSYNIFLFIIPVFCCPPSLSIYLLSQSGQSAGTLYL